MEIGNKETGCTRRISLKTHSLSELFVIFLRFSKLSLKLNLEYKFDRSLLTVAIFFREMISVVVMVLLLSRFLYIRDWDMNELLFLYSFLFLSYSLFVFFFAGVRDFDQLIYSGQFDRYITRPLGLLYQVLVAKIDLPATVGHGIVGIILFVNTAFSVGIEWNAQNIMYYILALVGGAIIQASIFMIAACFSFWTFKIENLRNLLFFNARRIAGYPITFYPALIQKMLIFVLPFSFVNYFPTLFFIDKDSSAHFWGGYLYLTPLVGVIMFLLAHMFWRFGIKHYSSTGNSM